MIKSLFRQMWNQRHANVWVWVELIVVLILLWYSIDLVYNYEAAARQSKGYDTENVFDIQLNICLLYTSWEEQTTVSLYASWWKDYCYWL